MRDNGSCHVRLLDLVAYGAYTLVGRRCTVRTVVTADRGGVSYYKDVGVELPDGDRVQGLVDHHLALARLRALDLFQGQ